MLKTMKAALFDLDGVLVDTARYHFFAWKRLADSLKISFSEEDNEALKGVSRRESLEILLKKGRLFLPEERIFELMEIKNRWYVDLLAGMNADEMLEGAGEYLDFLRAQGVKIALGSASKNAPAILDKLGISELFDAVIDGNQVTRSKPDPEVFLLGASAVGADPSECVVFEDSRSGIAAARSAGMYTVGIGCSKNLPDADRVVPSLGALL